MPFVVKKKETTKDTKESVQHFDLTLSAIADVPLLRIGEGHKAQLSLLLGEGRGEVKNL